MSTTTTTPSRSFQPSRRAAHGVLVGIILVLGYFASVGIPSRHEGAPIAALEQMA